MAVYKVPQDVEAEDKLIGPLSFRQFIYAGISLGGVTVGFFLFQAFPLLAIIPLPVVILFGALALPLRKDQPMETYLLALLRFYLKPKLRMWNPDGTITYVEITAPQAIEQHLTKDLTGEMAQQRLDYLARVMDSRGWALKGATAPATSLTEDVAAEAQTTNDIMDKDASVSRSFDMLIAKKDQQRKQEARKQMHEAAKQMSAPTPTAPPNDAQASNPVLSSTSAQAVAPATPATNDDDDTTKLHYNPYPSAIRQKVVHTLEEQRQMQAAAEEAARLAKPAVPKRVSPDIMRLASNDDLSISAIANEAHRLQDKEEVVINLH